MIAFQLHIPSCLWQQAHGCMLCNVQYLVIAQNHHDVTLFLLHPLIYRAHCNAGTKLTLPELVEYTCTDGTIVKMPLELATDYVQFGTFLLDGRHISTVNIMAHKYHYNAEQINTEILQEWLNGRGKQPVTWATLVSVLKYVELSSLGDDIEAVKCLVRPG